MMCLRTGRTVCHCPEKPFDANARASVGGGVATTSVSPSGHRISTRQPVPGFFRAMKVGCCSSIRRICAGADTVQASYPAITPGDSPSTTQGNPAGESGMRGLSGFCRFERRHRAVRYGDEAG
jgi:hypothetical protein